ncbi:MAG: serine/threonine protein kinase [Polyangiaceae bacterium]
MEAAQGVLVAGYKLDRYELLCPIASGGMATVWLAQLRGKRGFEKLFAIKTIRTELLEDPRFQEMFLDEARIASGIQHPNVAQILDLGEQRDVLFIVMEWVDGDSLAKVRKLMAKRGSKLPVGIALRILADACAGLHAAHELRDQDGEPLGIVHRDVSPQNILIAASGSVKVIDFGIAKAQNRKQGETRTGVVKGKIQYMAPEQVKKGRTVDRRADIWSLGICLHELVAGKTPNDGDDDVEIIRKLLADEAPRIADGLPAPVVRILEASIVLDPDARYPTAAGMQRALDGAMKELGETATSEDVAGVLRAELPELLDGRRGVVNKAIEGARERGTPPVGGSGDVAFAATMVSERSPRALDEARAIALTRRKAESGSRSARGPASGEDSRVRPSSPPDQEPLRIPKRSRAGLWAVLFLIAAAGASIYRWPGPARRLFGVGGDTQQPARDAASRAADAVHTGPTFPPPGAVSATTASSAAKAVVTPAGVAASASGHHAGPEPSGHLLSHGAPVPSASAAAPSWGLVPHASASASAPPWPELSALPTPPAPPTPSAPPTPPEDSANPYTN